MYVSLAVLSSLLVLTQFNPHSNPINYVLLLFKTYEETEAQRVSVTCPADTTKKRQSQDCPHLPSGFSLWALHHHTRRPLWGCLTLKSCRPRGMEQPGEGVYTPLLSKVNPPFLLVFKQRLMSCLRSSLSVCEMCVSTEWNQLWMENFGFVIYFDSKSLREL